MGFRPDEQHDSQGFFCHLQKHEQQVDAQTLFYKRLHSHFLIGLIYNRAYQ
jgi:hypothetical protein